MKEHPTLVWQKTRREEVRSNQTRRETYEVASDKQGTRRTQLQKY
jgi:hypothetical protein